MAFKPNYHHLEQAARNIEPARLPLYEHTVSDSMIERILGVEMTRYFSGKEEDLDRYFENYCTFFMKMGFDTVSFEACAGGAFPGSGALGGHITPAISGREAYEQYPWGEVEERYFRLFGPQFDALRRHMPVGMKAVGGVGNGVFECVQDLVGYTNLCFLSYDDPPLYAELFERVGGILERIWHRFLDTYGELYCVCRFGDDLGFKSTTLISTEDIQAHIIPQYRKIIEAVHGHGKPFLLHSCGQIFDVMEALIAAGIDAKHSNEDQIAPFYTWVERYGGRIGNFGGIDTDILCRSPAGEIEAHVLRVIEQCRGHGGFALGSGNSIPDYVPTEGFRAMNRAARIYRGEPAEDIG